MHAKSLTTYVFFETLTTDVDRGSGVAMSSQTCGRIRKLQATEKHTTMTNNLVGSCLFLYYPVLLWGV